MQIMAYSSFPKGSEWRKWDLHLHSPMSGLANKFPKINNSPDWEQYILALEGLDDCPAIAITDYFLIEGYKKVIESKENGRLRKIQLILPNIEFRLDNFVGEKRINFHVIFSDEVSIRDIEDHFLSDLEITIEGSPWNEPDTRKLKRSTLEELGAKLKEQQPSFEGTNFEIGCKTAVVKREQIMKILTTNGLFKDKYLTALAEEKNSLMEWGSQDHQVRRLLIQSSHFIFVANPKSIAWYLGKKHSNPSDFAEEFKSLKPCAIGSDAHRLEEIGVAPNGKFTWIKADVTFDGLRQIVYEPEGRIFIGGTPPDEKDSTKVIESITIGNSHGWFEDQIIPLNRDLVTIIGGKGSGKTALADLLAYAGGDFNFHNKQAFLTKATDELNGTILKLKWAGDDKATTCIVNEDNSNSTERKVRYLSQSFVENLCSFDQHEKLARQIEDILFQYVPQDKRLGAKDLTSLKEIKTRSIQLEINKISSTIKHLNGEIFQLELDQNGRVDLIAERDRLAKEKIDLEAQKPVVANQAEKSEQDRLQKLRAQKSELERKIEELRLRMSELQEFKTQAKLLKGDVETFNADIARSAKALGLENDKGELLFGIPLRIDEIVEKRMAAMEREILSFEGRTLTENSELGKNLSGTETLSDLEKQIDAIEKKSTLEAQEKRKLIEFGRRITEITTRIETLNKVVEALDTTKRQLLDEKVKLRDDEFLRFFKKLDEKKNSLEELYKPLNEPTGASIERGKVQFYARFSFNSTRFVSDGIRLFDGRKTIFRGESGLAVWAEDYWKQIQKLLPNMTIDPVSALLSILQNIGKTSEPREFKSQLRSDFSHADVYNWIYCSDYFDVEYGIKYENVDLNKLSPGRKGVVLLLIYLDVDRDFRPLIIDQPEENLDNRSVYSTLVQYFRKAKEKRQIILVTHNANLVVNADAEQVIVANFDMEQKAQNSKIAYVSGSLEFRRPIDPLIIHVLLQKGIREHVCEILEGGDEAFQRREHKYGFVRR
jgi:hypothetical protein